jgi:neuralized-like protein 4
VCYVYVMRNVYVMCVCVQVKEHYGRDLGTLGCGDRVGVLVDSDSCLHVVVNGNDQGVATREVPQPCFALCDVYGQCTQVGVHLSDI